MISDQTAETQATHYRSHTCGELRAADEGATVTLSGWTHIIRDHGNLIFIDLRDSHGVTQCVLDQSSPIFETVSKVHSEDVLKIEGRVVKRTAETINPELPTGEIEVVMEAVTILNTCEPLPFPVSSNVETSEELRLRYRYLDLRRQKLHSNIVLRSRMINAWREQLTARGFLEMQTPILTASSPEGARDFLVPSRLHPGKFFALPQSPQQFKQLLMVGGFERYFQIAPCFRDEAARADRSPGEHYQVDLEMSFVSQDDVFAVLEPIFYEIFSELGNKEVSPLPFRRIPYREAMLSYGSDKPDLRNPLLIKDVSDIFTRDDVTFNAFKSQVAKNAVVRAIFAPGCADKPRSWFDGLNDWMRGEGGGGLAYIILGEDGEARGPIAKFFEADALGALKTAVDAKPGGVIFFVCDAPMKAPGLAGMARDRLGADLDLIDGSTFEFCWIVDFPMFELDEETGKLDFAHNPFSMPQGGLEALETQDPLDVLAFQYDIVCNGYELSSGAVRNHLPQIMLKAFDMVGYPRAEVEDKFSGLLTALRFGAPPHAGCAPGVDRMIMLLCDEPNIREVIAFPMNQQQQDLLMHAPNTIDEARLRELHIRSVLPPKEKK